jgi:hypothetical protein
MARPIFCFFPLLWLRVLIAYDFVRFFLFPFQCFLWKTLSPITSDAIIFVVDKLVKNKKYPHKNKHFRNFNLKNPCYFLPVKLKVIGYLILNDFKFQKKILIGVLF